MYSAFGGGGNGSVAGAQRNVTEKKAGVGTFRNDVLPSFHYNCSGTRTNVCRRVAGQSCCRHGERLRTKATALNSKSTKELGWKEGKLIVSLLYVKRSTTLGIL